MKNTPVSRWIYVYIAAVFFGIGAKLYFAGQTDGIRFYKNSHSFDLTLQSMYTMGYNDGKVTQ